MATQSKQLTSSLAACVESNYFLGAEAKFDLDKNEAAHCEAVLAARRDDTFAFFQLRRICAEFCGWFKYTV